METKERWGSPQMNRSFEFCVFIKIRGVVTDVSSYLNHLQHMMAVHVKAMGVDLGVYPPYLEITVPREFPVEGHRRG